MVQPVPEGYTTVTPWIATRDSIRAMEFIASAFDGTELGRVMNEDGSVGHAEMRIGDAIVLLFDAKDDWPDTPALIRLYVPEIDKVFANAVAAGAQVVTELVSHAWGDRVGRVRDPLGNIWWLMEHVEDVDQDEQMRRFGEPKYLEAMRYTQESLNEEMRRRRTQ